MTFTYSSTSLTTDLSYVRLLIDDTDSTDPEFTDEEIDVFLDIEADVMSAAAVACDALAAKYAAAVDKAVGDLKLSLSQKAKAYLEAAKKYRARAKTYGAANVFAGGISKSDKETREADTDRVEPAFHVGMFDLPDAIVTSTSS